MRQQDEVDLFGRHAEPLQGVQQMGHGRSGTCIDECRSSLLDDEMTGVQAGAHIVCVDGVDTVLGDDERGNFRTHRVT